MAGRVRRGLVGLVVLSSSMAVSSGGAGAAAADRPVEALEWRGYAGSVVLTDCNATDPAGTECTAWDVFAFRERVGVNGDRAAHTVISVTVYDVTITADPLAPVIAARAGGALEGADVTVTPNLSRASAAGTIDLFVCDAVACTPTGQTVDLDVTWTAAGRAERYHDRLRDLQGAGALLNVMFFGAFRPATVVAEVDGEPVNVVPEPIVGQPQLHFDASTELCLRCVFPPLD